MLRVHVAVEHTEQGQLEECPHCHVSYHPKFLPVRFLLWITTRYWCFYRICIKLMSGLSKGNSPVLENNWNSLSLHGLRCCMRVIVKASQFSLLTPPQDVQISLWWDVWLGVTGAVFEQFCFQIGYADKNTQNILLFSKTTELSRCYFEFSTVHWCGDFCLSKFCSRHQITVTEHVRTFF